MTLQFTEVQDFQSIAKEGLEFDKFTVLVGPSSSGKSAFLRAVRSLVRNTFVPANVRQGSSKALVHIVLHGHDIWSERGKSLSTYYLDGEPYPKSGKSVPEDIVKVLRMPLVEGIDPSFSFQFDRPFLLAESGSTAASVIGSLTNVSVLHAAVREANRRRGNVSSTLKIRFGDKERLQAQVETFRYLPARKRVLDRARNALQSAQGLQATLDSLQAATSSLEASEAFLDTFTLPSIPDLDFTDIEADLAELRTLEELVDAVEGGLTSMKRHGRIEVGINAAMNALDEEYEDLLKKAGICPTCGRPINES